MRGWKRCAVLLGMAATAGARAQMHKVAKPERVVRAVGVYEWTGDLAHPTASRLVPVSLFIDGELQDAGVYLPQPVPFAIDSGTEYELDAAGVPRGDLALQSAAKVQTPDDAYTDGWIGYGNYRPPVTAVARQVASGKGRPARLSGTVEVAETNGDKPHFSSRSDDATKDTAKGKASPSDAGSTTAGDTDRPTLQRRTDTANTTGDAAPAGSGGDTSSDDPAERPTLKRRTPESSADAKKDKKKKQQQASVTGVGSLNDDPDRPTLHRGSGVPEAVETPKLLGVPPNMNQMVAVSDAARRDPHPFARPWESEAERQAVLVKMRAMAMAQLAAYISKAGSAAARSNAQAAKSATTVPRLRPGAGSGVKSRRAGPAAAATPALSDEDLRGFLLSYGGAPTYTYTAHTAGTGEALHYVTVVAQVATAGDLTQAMAVVTDAAHLDRTPWFRLVDAVDAEASNRASLLFELRGGEARQFALYRVLGGRADQIFATGTTQ